MTIAALAASGVESPDGLAYDVKSKVDELVTAVNAGTIVGNPVVGVAGGYKIARGETALDGGNPTPVATGLTTVVAFVATLKGTAAPGVSTSVLTADISGATVNVYAWKPTSTSVPTLVASTGTESFGWIAVGT
jgi:hypothetical protein